jgi:hypothetical protein
MLILFKNKIQIRKSNNLITKNIQKINIFIGLFISTATSLFLFLNAQKAQERDMYWVVKNQIPTGQIISKKDIELVPVDLGKIKNSYLKNEAEIVGEKTLVPLEVGYFIDKNQIGQVSNSRDVALRISNGHLPPSLQINDWVDIWFSDPLTLASKLLIEKISVVWIDEVNTNYGGVTTVVLAVPKNLVPDLVNAARTDGLDLVKREN